MMLSAQIGPVHIIGTTCTDDPLAAPPNMLADIADRCSFLLQDDDSHTELRKHSRTGRPLGDEPFLIQLEEMAGRALRPSRRGDGVRSSFFAFPGLRNSRGDHADGRVAQADEVGNCLEGVLVNSDSVMNLSVACLFVMHG
jgi:hypothetical protein